MEKALIKTIAKTPGRCPVSGKFALTSISGSDGDFPVEWND